MRFEIWSSMSPNMMQYKFLKFYVKNNIDVLKKIFPCWWVCDFVTRFRKLGNKNVKTKNVIYQQEMIKIYRTRDIIQ